MCVCVTGRKNAPKIILTVVITAWWGNTSIYLLAYTFLYFANKHDLHLKLGKTII